jgi:hypothetical protein
MRSLTTAPIALPAERIDLAAWIARLSEPTYLASAPRHHAMGRFADDDGTRGLIQVETIATVLMIHHYRLAIARPDRVYLLSERTRGWLLNLVPHSFTVFSCLSVHPRSAETCELRFHIDIAFHHRFFAALSRVAVFPIAVVRHAQAETEAFARDIERMFRASPRPARRAGDARPGPRLVAAQR